MKTTRKLIPALVMLLVSAIMLSTASFAWFATSTEVTAENMTVKAKANTKFLQISNSSTGSSWGIVASPEDTETKELDLVRPVIEGGSVTKWQTATSDDSASGVVNDAGHQDVAQEDVEDYVLQADFWVKMSDNSSATLSNLKIEKVTSAADEGSDESSLAKALRVLVVGANGLQLWTNETGTWAADPSYTNAILTSVTKDAQKITVYVYYDGESSVANSNTAAPDSLTNMQVSVTFTAE
jgi:hypothetical protein